MKDEDDSPHHDSSVVRKAALQAVRRKSSLRRQRLDTLTDSEMSLSELSIGGSRRRKKGKRKNVITKSASPPLPKKQIKGLR